MIKFKKVLNFKRRKNFDRNKRKSFKIYEKK